MAAQLLVSSPTQAALDTLQAKPDAWFTARQVADVLSKNGRRLSRRETEAVLEHLERTYEAVQVADGGGLWCWETPLTTPRSWDRQLPAACEAVLGVLTDTWQTAESLGHRAQMSASRAAGLANKLTSAGLARRDTQSRPYRWRRV